MPLATLDNRKSSNLMKKLAFKVTEGWKPLEFWSTGSLRLNWLLGGGLPIGKIGLIGGPHGKGKTTVTNAVVANMLRNGIPVLWIDTESKWTWEQAKGLGVPNPSPENRFFHTNLFDHDGKPGSLEQMWNTVEEAIRENVFGLIVIDSKDGAVPQEMMNKAVGEKSMAAAAGANTIGMRKVAGALEGTDTSLLIVSQVRHNFNQHGPEWIIPGGAIIQHMAFWQMLMTQTFKNPVYNKDQDGLLAADFPCRMIRNSGTHRSLGKADIRINFDNEGNGAAGGFDLISELTDLGKTLNVFTKEDGSPIKGSSAWYFGGQKLTVGEANVRKMLNEDVELREAVGAAVQAAIKNASAPQADGAQQPENDMEEFDDE